jgi:hypothetical protein
MKILFALFASISLLNASAQNYNIAYWKILLNKQLVYSGNERIAENSRTTTLQLSDKRYSKGFMDLTYKQVKPDNTWRRSFMLMDEADYPLASKDLVNNNGQWLLPVTMLKKYAAGKKKLLLYTISLPKDPAVAATVKVRRELLCVLLLQ